MTDAAKEAVARLLVALEHLLDGLGKVHVGVTDDGGDSRFAFLPGAFLVDQAPSVSKEASVSRST